MYSFAEGLFDFFHGLAKQKPDRLNKHMKEILFQMIEETKETTYDMSETTFTLCMESFNWLEKVLSGSTKAKPKKEVGWWLCHWINDNEYHHLSGEEDFDKAMVWLSYKIRKHYSDGELTQHMMENG